MHGSRVFLTIIIFLLSLTGCNDGAFQGSSGVARGGSGDKFDLDESQGGVDASDGVDADESSGDDSADTEGGDGNDGSDTDDGDLEEEDTSKDPTGLTIRSIERDDETTFHIKDLDGEWVAVPFPDEGETVVIPNICQQSGTTDLELYAVDEAGRKREITEGQCFLGSRQSDDVVVIGFEDDCNSTKYSKIDEELGFFSCPQSDLDVPGLRMQANIDIDDWD